MLKPLNSVVLVPVGLGFVMLSFGAVALAAVPSSVAVANSQAGPGRSVANCCQDHLTDASAKRDGETRAQCAPQVAEVDQGGGPQAPEPVAEPTLHQAANSAKPGR